MPALAGLLSINKLLLKVMHQLLSRFGGMSAKECQRSGDEEFFLVVQRHDVGIMLPVHPAVSQAKAFFDGAGKVGTNILAIAFDMAEITLRKLQPRGECFQHATARFVRVLVYEIVKQFHKVAVTNLCAIQGHQTTFLPYLRGICELARLPS